MTLSNKFQINYLCYQLFHLYDFLLSDLFQSTDQVSFQLLKPALYQSFLGIFPIYRTAKKKKVAQCFHYVRLPALSNDWGLMLKLPRNVRLKKDNNTP